MWPKESNWKQELNRTAGVNKSYCVLAYPVQQYTVSPVHKSDADRRLKVAVVFAAGERHGNDDSSWRRGRHDNV